MTTIGKVQDFTREFTFEWSIDDFFSLSEEEGKYYYSPDFLMDGEYWCLNICPNGESNATSFGYISLFLRRNLSGLSKSLNWSFALKTADGKKDCEINLSRMFTNEGGWGYSYFLKRSELLHKKAFLVPSDILTIICTIELCSKSDDEAGNILTTECPHCKKEYDDKYVSSHKEKCLAKPIACPSCNGTVPLKKWCDHECRTMRAKVNEKLVKDLTDIFETEEYSDVTVSVKDKEFRLHKNILAGRNTYFKTMLNTEMKEKVTGTVSINDCEPGIFRSFIHFLYTGKMDDLTVENVCELYVLADKYQENQLKEECVYLMKKEMCVETFCDFIVLALKYDEKELLKNATSLFCSKIKEIIKSVKWQSFIQQYPTQANELHIKAVDYYVK